MRLIRDMHSNRDAAFEHFALCQSHTLPPSRLHGLHRHCNVIMILNQDDRHVFPIGREMLLQIKAIETGKRNVESATTRHKTSFTT